MNEQKDNGQEQGKDKEKEKKIQTKSAPKKKQKMSGERKFYLFTAIGCAAVLIAIIIVAIAVTNSNDVEQGMRDPSSSESVIDPEPDESGDGDKNQGGEKPDEPVAVVPEGMTLPVQTASLLNDHGFYHNKTLNNYYVHVGVDFAASAGTEVFAVEDGVVESIYKDDILLGTEITIDHGDGLKSVYRFVTEADGLKVGAKVERGEVIATVAEPTGNEYKDGAHLHFEILENGKSVDPTTYLTLEEK